MYRSMLACLVAAVLVPVGAFAQSFPSTDTAFSYQGRLDESGGPASGTYDFRFTLFARMTGGSPLAPSVEQTLDVDGGLFTATLDFGAGPLAGREVYLEIAVAPKGGLLTVLQPRQRVRPAPAAVQSGSGNFTPAGEVILSRGPDTGSEEFILNDPGTGADNFATAPTFWQSFTAPYQASLDSIRLLVKRPTSSTPAPGWVLYEGLGTGGSIIGGGGSSWSFLSGSLYILDMYPISLQPVFVPGRVYTFAISGTDLSFSQVPIVGEGVGQSSAGTNIASLFTVNVGLVGPPEVKITSSGDLEVNTGNPKIEMNSSNQFQPVQWVSTFADTNGNQVAYWEWQGRPESYGLKYGRFTDSILHVDGASKMLGLNEIDPLASVHVQGLQLSLGTAAFEGEDVVVEDGDAVLGLYSNGGGTFGSAIALGEIGGNGALVDKWSMHRRTSGFNKELQFAYGSSNFYSQNIINFALRPDGSAWLRGALQQNSSAAAKHDIDTLTDAVDTLLRLRGVSYRWDHTGERDIGFLAEEMADVLPEVVGFDEHGKPIGIDYGRLTALIVEATKDQQRRLQLQAAEIETLKELCQELAERLDQLENRDRD